MSLDDHGRPEPQIAADEEQTLVGFLDYQRATLEWKTRGLGASELARTTGASAMTLGGLLKHMAYVEDHWFEVWMLDAAKRLPWSEVDWVATPDWEWETALHDPPDELRGLWSASVERSRNVLSAVLAAADPADRLGTLARRRWPSGEQPSVRWILVHMIEEYARHNGHADILREAVDGEVGE